MPRIFAQAPVNTTYGEPSFSLLDFGCGLGRDHKVFASLGHSAIEFDGGGPFVALAQADTGCELWHQDFPALELPGHRFDGIFANASLFHVPSRELPCVLPQLHAALST